jgi:hypothetical protein
MTDPTNPSAPSTGGIQIKTFVDPEHLKRDVEFSPADLDDAMTRHAALFVHYAAQAAQARRQFDRMKATVEILESKLYAEKRETLTQAAVDGVDPEDKKAKPKLPTEAQVDAAVKSDPRWMKAQVALIDARAQADLANDAREAFRQREGMIIQLASDRRKEREGELRMGAAKQVSDGLRADALRILSEQKAA